MERLPRHHEFLISRNDKDLGPTYLVKSDLLVAPGTSTLASGKRSPGSVYRRRAGATLTGQPRRRPGGTKEGRFSGSARVSQLLSAHSGAARLLSPTPDADQVVGH